MKSARQPKPPLGSGAEGGEPLSHTWFLLIRSGQIVPSFSQCLKSQFTGVIQGLFFEGFTLETFIHHGATIPHYTSTNIPFTLLAGISLKHVYIFYQPLNSEGRDCTAPALKTGSAVGYVE